jgi:DNA (cytosine-5)-methyltransferase 1
VAALTANGVGTCGADDNQAQAGHLIAQPSTVIGGGLVHSLTSEGHDASEDGTGRGTPIVAEHYKAREVEVTQPLMTAPTGGNQGGDYIVQPLAIRGREGEAVRQETIVRRLTELECERLQGYPDGWTEGQTASARYRQLGNSVAVPCVEWIARRLIAVDEAAQ